MVDRSESVADGEDAVSLEEYPSKRRSPGADDRPSTEAADNIHSDDSEEEGLLLEDVSSPTLRTLYGENEIRIQHLAALYTSHALSMWNNRSYEFAAVLFTASAFPNTLVVAALRGMAGHLASLVLSPSVGTWCDRQPSRLRTLLLSIVVQRICITLGCLGWVLIVQNKVPDQNDAPEAVDISPAQKIALPVLILLGMVEKLSQVANLITMERDWIPLIAHPDATLVFDHNPSKRSILSAAYDLVQANRPLQLHLLNATIKRIDLVCKLIAPLVVSAIVLGMSSVRAAAIVIAVTQLLSVGPELYLAWLVWSASSSLQSPKQRPIDTSRPARFTTSGPGQTSAHPFPQRSFAVAMEQISAWVRGVCTYFMSPTLLPSLAYAMEPFSVLTMASSMTVYLLAAHFPLWLITTARAASTGVELLSTIATPILISWLSSRQTGSQQIKGQPRALVQVGQWGLYWQLGFLIPATTILLLLPSSATNDPSTTSPVLEVLLFTTLALSRVGPFAYALVEQQLVQVTVPEHERMEFSGVEMALVDLAELFRWAMLGIFGNPDQFRFVALASFVTVGLSAGLFWLWRNKAANQPA